MKKLVCLIIGIQAHGLLTPLEELKIKESAARAYRNRSMRPQTIGMELIGNLGLGDDITARIERDGTDYYVSFPGMRLRKKEGIATSFDFVPVRHPSLEHGARAHRGWSNMIRRNYADLDNAVASADRVFIQGHSAGGALALLYGTSRLSRGRLVTSIYTFGSPAIGNTEFRDQVALMIQDSVEYKRVIYGNDIVPKMLPWYTHIDLPHTIKSSRSITLFGYVRSFLCDHSDNNYFS